MKQLSSNISNPNYYPMLDSLRFFAAFLVIISHWAPHKQWVHTYHLGSIGVDFFFVISGYLISKQLFKSRAKIENKESSFSKELSTFIKKRIWRIFPLYYLILIASTLANKGAIRDAFWYNISYLSNFYFIKVGHWTSNFSHFWSLSVEEHFYIFWPIMVLLFNSKKTYIYASIIALISITYRSYHINLGDGYFTAYCHSLSCFDLFMVGAILGFYHMKHPNFKVKGSIGILALGVLISILILLQDTEFIWLYIRPIAAIIYGIIIMVATTNRKEELSFTGKILAHPYLIRLGQFSYAIYLIHLFIPGMLMPIKEFGSIRYLVYFVTTILISGLLHHYFEKPLRKLGKRPYLFSK